MASNLFTISSTPSFTLSTPTRASFFFSKPSHVQTLRFSGYPALRRTVVTRAGPSTNSYLLAFLLPASLLAITVFTSIRIADKLDRDFLEDLAINQAIREAEEKEYEEDEDEDEDEKISIKEVQEPVLSRTRNRPKREV